MPVWKTLRHNGVAFPPLHSPTGLAITVRGESLTLSPLGDEMVYQFAKKKDTPYVQDPVFVENFMKYFSKELPARFHGVKFSEVDISRFYRLVDEEKRRKETMTKEEKKVQAASRKQQREALKASYGKATIDDKEVDIANWLVEPPGLYMGRGQHPLRGSWKPRISRKDVTLNLDESAPVPGPSDEWGGIVHDKESIWIARWIDKLTEKEKYVWPHESSAIQQSRNREKYDKASRIEKKLDLVRRTVRDRMTKGDIKTKKISTVAYLIDKLGMRVGDEKDEDEADTVGATTLRVEHVRVLHDSVEFDFLGKDSVTGDSELYYKIDGKLHYSTFEDLVRRITPAKHWKDSEGRELIVPSARLEVLTMDEPDQRKAKITWAPVTEVMSHEVSKPIFNIELAGGQRIGATGDHSLFMQNKSNPCLAIASPVRRMSAIDSIATASGLPIDLPDLLSVNSIPLTDDLLTLCGLWLADGRLTQKSVIISAGGDGEILSFIGDMSKGYRSEMEVLLEKAIDSNGSPLNYQRGRAQTVLSQLRDRGSAFGYHMNAKGDIWCFSSTLVRLLQRLGLDGFSAEKDIPEWMHSLSDRQIGLVLKGYFSGDGGVSSKGTAITAGSVSRELIKHVRTLLLRLGIDSTVGPAKGKSGLKASGPQWVLHIGRNEDRAKFISGVRFMQKRKNAGIQISRVRHGRSPLSWRRIRSIALQPSDHSRVYDLSVRGTERFITNGMLAHNSVRWVKTIPETEPALMENLRRFTKGKKPEDEIFDGVTSSMVNRFFSGIVPDLTAKVFRTFHATKVAEASLLAKDVKRSDELEKLYFAKEANLRAAEFCNHKRTPPKNWDESLRKKEEKLAEYRAKGKEAMIRKMEMNVEFTKKTKDYNLNTSLKNYIDPRIYKSWCDYVGLDWNKLYTSSLQKKFSWVEKSKKPWPQQEQVAPVVQQS